METGAKQVFRSNPMSVFFNLIQTAVIIGLICTGLVIWLKPDIQLWVFVLGGLLLSLVIIFLFRTVKVTVTEENVVVKKGLSSETLIRADGEFTTHITRHYYNGIPSGTDRFLVFMGKRRLMVNMSKKAFDRLYSAILPKFKAEGTPLAEAAEYTIPRDAIIGAQKKIINNVIIVFVVILIAGLGVGFYVSSKNGMDILPIIALGIGALVLIIVLVAAVPLSVQLRRLKKMVPARISFGDGKVSFDDTTIELNQIDKIIMTPPSYNTNAYSSDGHYRTVDIKTLYGRHKYILGHRAHKSGETTFPHYEELCVKLKGSLSENATFQYDL